LSRKGVWHLTATSNADLGVWHVPDSELTREGEAKYCIEKRIDIVA
jgi:hypothetical protein